MSNIYLSELYYGPGSLNYVVSRLTDEYVYNFTSGTFEDNANPTFQTMTNPSSNLYEGVVDDRIVVSGVDYTVDYVDTVLSKVVASTSLNNYQMIQYEGSGIVYIPSGVVYVPSGIQTNVIPQIVYVNGSNNVVITHSSTKTYGIRSIPAGGTKLPPYGFF